MKPTPKPWIVIKNGLRLDIHHKQPGDRELTVACDVREADAPLIAAAPDLYEALQEAHTELSGWIEDAEINESTRTVLDTIVAALAKAEEEA